MSSRVRFENLLQQVRQDANQHGDVEVVLQLDEFSVFQGSHSDEVAYTEYLVPDLGQFFERFDNAMNDHESEVNCFWEVLNEHYQYEG